MDIKPVLVRKSIEKINLKQQNKKQQRRLLVIIKKLEHIHLKL